MRFAAFVALIGFVASSGVSFAGLDEAVFGLRWGQSAEEAAEAADAKVLYWTIHQRFGQSFEMDRLPVSVGGEIHRTLYFNDENQLLRVWVSFGHPGGEAWEKNYRLDAAVAKYQALKASYGANTAGTVCTEPELAHSEQQGREVLDPKFPRDQTVWFCEYGDEGTQLILSLRRLGDQRGERFDVTVDAQDRDAVAAYRKKHPLRGHGHGVLAPVDETEPSSREVDCEVAESSDRSTMDTSPFALLYRRICEYEATNDDEVPRFDEVILLDP